MSCASLPLLHLLILTAPGPAECNQASQAYFNLPQYVPHYPAVQVKYPVCCSMRALMQQVWQNKSRHIRPMPLHCLANVQWA